MPKNRPIKHLVTFNQSRTTIHVAAWFYDQNGKPAADAYCRCFDATDWPRAAAYLDELKRGHVTGRY